MRGINLRKIAIQMSGASGAESKAEPPRDSCRRKFFNELASVRDWLVDELPTALDVSADSGTESRARQG